MLVITGRYSHIPSGCTDGPPLLGGVAVIDPGDTTMLYRATEPPHFQDAEQATRQGNHARAYNLLRQTLIDHPTYVPAWLSMSALVEDRARQRECLDRVLALDPQNVAARDRLERLRLQDLLSPMRALVLRDLRGEARQLGAHLLEQAILTADQLHQALCEQRRRRQRGAFIQLGDLLLEWGWIAPTALVRALVAQIQEKIAQHPGHAPQFLGEYLIAEGIITPMQLEVVLEEQIRLRLAGQRVALGQLLIRKGALSPRTLQMVLDDQRAAFYSRMGD
jgi:hypothetical protein